MMDAGRALTSWRGEERGVSCVMKQKSTVGNAGYRDIREFEGVLFVCFTIKYGARSSFES